MTEKEFLECVNGVDDDLIENVEMLSAEDTVEHVAAKNDTDKKHRAQFFKYVVAACIIIAVGAGVANKMLPSDSMKVGERNTVKPEKQKGVATSETEGLTLPEMLVFNNAEFSYNNRNYKVINDKEFLYSNNLMTDISKSDIGSKLKKNILDISGNNVLGDLYSYKNSSNQDIVILKANDGSYNFAFSEEEDD